VGDNEHAHRGPESEAHLRYAVPLGVVADYLRPLTLLQAVSSALVLVSFTFMVDFAINAVTGGTLPGPLARYPWLAWPAVGLGFLLSVATAIRERLRHQPAPRHGGTPSAPRPPKELPRDIAEFTGRRKELDALRALVPDPDAARPAAPTIITVYGAPGTGKSALAIHFAYEMQDQYPDGQLYVHLKDAGDRPIRPVEALTQLVRSLGLRGLDLPPDQGGLLREYSAVIRGKRAIIVLDNATDAAQVGPLLPSSPACLVLITCRNQLRDLLSSTPFKVDPMSRSDAFALLARIAGKHVLDPSNEAAVEQVASLCGYLPLALALAGAQLRGRALSDVASRMSARGANQERVYASFDVSYQALPMADRALFRRLRLLPETSFGARVAAGLLDCTPRQAEDALDRLVENQLLEQVGDGHYGFNDLIGEYATLKLEHDEPLIEREAATGRALRIYLEEAMDEGAVLDSAIREVIGESASPLPIVTLDEQIAALDWFERERPKLVRVLQRAVDIRAHDVVWKLAASLVPFFDYRGHRADWNEVQRAALAAARASGELYAQVWTWVGGGRLRWLDGRREEARFHLENALEGASAGGWPRLQARALYLLGRVEHDNHQLAVAQDLYGRAAAIFSQQGFPYEDVSTVFALATALHEQGDVSGAHAMHLGESAVANLAGRPQDLWVVSTMGEIKRGLGRVAEELGNLERAGTCYIGSHETFRRIGFKHGRGRALRDLGRIKIAQQNYVSAREFLEESAETFRAIGDADEEASARKLLDQLPERLNDQREDTI
jgi:tetratricopeptide (TPR) repeat protein